MNIVCRGLLSVSAVITAALLVIHRDWLLRLKGSVLLETMPNKPDNSESWREKYRKTLRQGALTTSRRFVFAAWATCAISLVAVVAANNAVRTWATIELLAVEVVIVIHHLSMRRLKDTGPYST
jgi:hypothetical protein